MKWYKKVLIILCVIVFLPIIILFLLCAGIAYLFQLPKNKKQYFHSPYYQDFHEPFMLGILYTPNYRVYNGLKKRSLPITYVKQESNGFEYFIYQETLYLLPDFDQIDRNDDGVWEADYDGDWQPFYSAYQKLVDKLAPDALSYPIKLLVERKMFPMTDLNGIDLPQCVFLTHSYETAFENETTLLKLTMPTTAEQLYEMMCQTPDLAGTFSLTQQGEIIWDLWENMQIQVEVAPQDCCIDISKKIQGKPLLPLTHWHPTVFEIYDNIYQMGKRGNVVVIRSFFGGAAVLYTGDPADCPYSPTQKRLYYLKAE